MKLFGNKGSEGKDDDGWAPPGYDGPEWSAWYAAIEELGGDPSVESFEQVVAAGKVLLEASMPPPGSHRPGPNRMIPLVELWNAQAEALRESQARRSGS